MIQLASSPRTGKLSLGEPERGEVPAERIKFTRTEIAAYYAARLPQLKQIVSGEWRGPCPIHQGDRDSFAVDPKTGNWFCHSECGRGGDLIGLEMELSHTNFKSAKAAALRISGRVPCTASKMLKKAFPQVAEYAWTFLDQRVREFAEVHDLMYVATYAYRYPDGRFAYVKVKFRATDGKKTFQKYAPTEKGGWTTPAKTGIPPLLYSAHLLADADEIHLCNGEKAANAGRKLSLVTTCLPDGEAKWNRRFTQSFEGKRVVVYLDKDATGDSHGKVVAHALFGHASEIRLAKLPNLPPKGDLYDWIKGGGTADELREIIDATPVVDGKLGAELDGHNDSRRKPKLRSDYSQFRLTDDAVLSIDPDPEKEPLKICGRLEIAALTRDARGDGWGRLLKWTDAEGREHAWSMPMSLLSGDGSEYRGHLLDGGLVISPGRKARELLTTYIQNAKPAGFVRCVSRIGWQGDAFVLPSETIGASGSETILFQTAYESEHLINVSGTLEEWRNNVGRFCSSNSRLILAVSCALAGMTLDLMGAESGGLHFVGPSSSGKTTALNVGGSVLGGGGRNGFVQTWHATRNGLEAAAELHNDLTLFLDELSQVDPHEASEIAYLLANGSGKQRMNRSIGARKKLMWRLMLMSAGEITLADHVQTARKRVRAGGEVRLLNIDADAGCKMGIFENIHGAKTADAFARQLKRAAVRFYGAPLRAWLEFLTKDLVAAKKALRRFRAQFLRKYLPLDASGEVSRAAQRFAIIGAAGELATQAGVTGWREGEGIDGAACCFQSWVRRRGTTGSSDAKAAIEQVRRFLEAHGDSRFQGLEKDDAVHTVRDRAGFRRRNSNSKETEYLVLQETFKTDLCSGYDFRAVCKALDQFGYLVREDAHWTIKPGRLPGFAKAVRVYCIRAAILR